MFHDATNIDISAIAQRININFDGIIEKAINQHRVGSRYNNRITHIAFKIGDLVNDFHRPPTKNIGWPDDNWQADTVNNRAGLFCRMGNAIFGLQQIQLL